MEVVEIRKSLRRAMQRRIDANLAPIDGKWVTRPVLEDRMRQERGKARVHALELLILYLGGALISLVMLSVFWWLCY